MCEVSVVIPVYNVEKYVERCVNSALDQDFTHEYEILIINDCGSDNSMLLVDSLAASHSKGNLIRIIHHTENKGLGEASNTRIREAKGKYLFFLDSDDWISKDCIRLLYEESERYQNEVTVAGMHRVTSKKNISSHGFDYFHIDQPAAFIQMSMIGNNVSETRWNKLFLLSFLRDNNIHCNHRWHEDIFFGYQVSCHCRRLSLLPDFTYSYFVNEDSITLSQKLNIEKLNQFVSIYRDICSFTVQYRQIPNIFDYYLAIVRGVFGHVSRLVKSKEDVCAFSDQAGQFLKDVPSVFSLKLWKNRLFYLLFYFQDSYLRFYQIMKLARCL